MLCPCSDVLQSRHEQRFFSSLLPEFIIPTVSLLFVLIGLPPRSPLYAYNRVIKYSRKGEEKNDYLPTWYGLLLLVWISRAGEGTAQLGASDGMANWDGFRGGRDNLGQGNTNYDVGL